MSISVTEAVLHYYLIRYTPLFPNRTEVSVVYESI